MKDDVGENPCGGREEERRARGVLCVYVQCGFHVMVFVDMLKRGEWGVRLSETR